VQPRRLPCRFKWLADAAGGRKVLDAGCGTGAYTSLLHRLGAASVTAIDIDPDQLAIARTFAAHVGADIRFVRASVESLPLPDQSVDLVFCRLVMPYVDKAQTLREFGRVLAPGGHALLMLHGPRYYLSLLKALRPRAAHLRSFTLGILGLVGGACVDACGAAPCWWSPKDPFFEAYDRPGTLERLLRRCGLRLIRWERGAFKPYAWISKPIVARYGQAAGVSHGNRRERSASDPDRGSPGIRPARIHRWLGEAAAWAIRCSGIPLAIRHLVARRKVTVLVYHDPPPAVFERHLKYLAKRYAFISMDRLVGACRDQDWSRISEYSLIITLDDGHRGNYDLLPLLRKHRVTPTVYLCSRIVHSGRHFWFRRCSEGALEWLKRCPQAVRLSILEERFGFRLDAEHALERRQSINLREMQEMAACVEFGSHTRLHPILTACSDAESSREIRQSKDDIELLLDKACRHFAYPNGDYGKREIEEVKASGYLSARTTDLGWNDVNTDPYRLKIVAITGAFSTNVLAAQLSGVTMFVRTLLRRLGGCRRVTTPSIRGTTP